MKKLFTALMCATMVLGTAGCGSNEKDLLNNPLDKDVENAIQKLDGIKSTCVVTEDNDLNGQLHKDGGYTGAVYFRLTQVDEAKEKEEYSTPYGDDACKVGTIGGGEIEIFQNKEDANKRNEYMSGFDGSVIGDFHTTKGTLVVRLSNDLTASQQKDLSTKIIEPLSEKQK